MRHPVGRKPSRGVAASARMELRVTPGEKEEIEALAESSGLSTNEYVRRRALGLEVPLSSADVPTVPGPGDTP